MTTLNFYSKIFDLRKKPDEKVWTYFLPTLTEEELDLVDKRDRSYYATFAFDNPDVDETEMMLSESSSKYLYGWSERRTFVIESPSKNELKKNCSFQ